MFLRIAMLSFGGGSLMWSQRVLVEQLRWHTDEQFLNAVSMCQVLPGPNLPNLAVVVGGQYRGVAGASAALAGVILIPLVILLTAGLLYFHYNDVGPVQAALTGMSAGAAGTACAAAIKLAQPFPWTARTAVMALGAFGAVAVLDLPLVLVLAILLPISIALAWRDA
ncbi:MAG: chromate transporter [Alphaproteobacteria bacterium]|nr:chromate transporter [Alphaproteobacteria bacterium]